MTRHQKTGQKQTNVRMSDTDPSPFPNHSILRFRPLSDG